MAPLSSSSIEFSVIAEYLLLTGTLYSVVSGVSLLIMVVFLDLVVDLAILEVLPVLRSLLVLIFLELTAVSFKLGSDLVLALGSVLVGISLRAIVELTVSFKFSHDSQSGCHVWTISCFSKSGPYLIQLFNPVFLSLVITGCI